MTTMTRHVAGLPRVPFAVLLLTIAIAVVSQLIPRSSTSPTAPAAPDAGTSRDAPTTAGAAFDPLVPTGGVTTTADLERIRADVTFWGDRFKASPRDFISATRLAASEIELARATGDITAYAAAGVAVDGAIKAYPDYPIAVDYRGVIQVALHQFAAARDNSTAVVADHPDDPTALATLGDATLELGDVAAASKAFAKLSALDDSAAARVRVAHLAFIEGHTAAAVATSRAAVAAATDEEATGNALAWYHYQLGDTLISTGDRADAAKAYAAALAADPRSHLALWGLARVAAADGRLDEAITDLDKAIDIIPLPEFVARRADLYRLRGATGDATLEAKDRKTVLAIAQLAGANANVYDRTLSLYLAGSGHDPVRALSLAQGEIAVRKDVYGYDALAWALLANGRPADAEAAMTTALAFGTKDAKLIYHAGMIAAALGDDATARQSLTDALALDASFDPLAATLAQAKLADLR
jgi:tetratricopeptide (TPR) repeat protein